ncbi:MAG: T9SS type A sorting domain-containing protein, partial [Bacteroidota bacterium]
PAASSLTVRSEGPMIQQLRLYNGLGQVVADRPVAATQVILAVETLAAGMYYLEIRTATGVVAQPIQVRH